MGYGGMGLHKKKRNIDDTRRGVMGMGMGEVLEQM
jgi:hypothetical protein